MSISNLVFATATAAALVLSAGPARAQQNIRTATSWPGGVHLEQFAQGFSKQAEALTGDSEHRRRDDSAERAAEIIKRAASLAGRPIDTLAVPQDLTDHGV